MSLKRKEDVGVYWDEDDRGSGPFMIRIGGTSDFVSKIGSDEVELVPGWTNKASLRFETIDEAIEAAASVWDIEGFHSQVEVASV